MEKNFEALVVTARGAVRERVKAKVAPRRALPIVAMVKGLMSPADEISDPNQKQSKCLYLGVYLVRT